MIAWLKPWLLVAAIVTVSEQTKCLMPIFRQYFAWLVFHAIQSTCAVCFAFVTVLFRFFFPRFLLLGNIKLYHCYRRCPPFSPLHLVASANIQKRQRKIVNVSSSFRCFRNKWTMNGSVRVVAFSCVALVEISFAICCEFYLVFLFAHIKINKVEKLRGFDVTIFALPYIIQMRHSCFFFSISCSLFLDRSLVSFGNLACT